jgi:hypothetical protein
MLCRVANRAERAFVSTTLRNRASGRAHSKYVVDVERVKAVLEPILADQDLAKHIL